MRKPILSADLSRWLLCISIVLGLIAAFIIAVSLIVGGVDRSSDPLSVSSQADGAEAGGTTSAKGAESSEAKTVGSASASSAAGTTLVVRKTVSTSAADATRTTGAGQKEIRVTPIQELNQSGTVNDHAADWVSSQLEPNYRQYVELTSSTLSVSGANYPRIKKIKSDQYILFYQDAQIGSNIYYSSSTDLIHWSAGRILFRSYPITVDGAKDTKCYSTCDALVLDNGEIMAIASFRSNKHFRSDNRYNGLAMKKSTDGGLTWSGEKVIYTGSNWEPSLLQLPDGEIQVYFTHSAPKNQPQIEAGVPTSEIVASSGTGMIRTRDYGKTWIPYVTDPPYAAQRVCQQYTGTVRGIKVFTDQMPVAIRLNNSNTVALVTESKFTVKGKEVYYITAAYNSDNWASGLGIDEEGPADKRCNMYSGAAPYIRQFPSGETVLSCNRNSRFQMRLGDALAGTFRDTPLEPLSKTGYWGSLELISSHDILGTMPYCVKVNGQSRNTIQISQNYLNHRIDLKAATIRIDGDNRDWVNNTDAFFLGSASQAQLSLRPAKGGDSICFLAEVLDNTLTDGERINLLLSDGTTGTLNRQTLRITASVDGTVQVSRWDGASFVRQDQLAGQIACAVTVKGTVGNSNDSDEGYILELQVPRTLLTVHGGSFKCYPELINSEPNGSTVTDTIEGTSMTKPSTWMTITVN